MFRKLQAKWKVSGRQLFLILCVFAITGTITAWISRRIAAWVGFGPATPWYWRTLLSLGVLIFGYQLIILLVAALFGQAAFFLTYMKRMWQAVGLIKKDRQPHNAATKETEHRMQNIENIAPTPEKRIAVFASGAGSNAQRLIYHFKNSTLARVALIVCNKPDAGVNRIAEKEGIPVLLIEKERFFRGDAYVALLQEAGINLVVLAGFLWKVPAALIAAFPNRIINIHPALLPKWGGKGMYGAFVHQAVLTAGESFSGITIHYVDAHYDNGDVIFQAQCPVLPGDTPQTLAARIHTLEHQHYPQMVEAVLRGEK